MWRRMILASGLPPPIAASMKGCSRVLSTTERHEAHDARDFRNGDRQDDDGDAGAVQRNQGDGKQNGWNRHQTVHHSHDDIVDAPEVARDETN